jgi:site-specific DNA-methyltransferase (adenine-specific)
MSIDIAFGIEVKPYYQNKGRSIKPFRGDCLQILPQFPRNSVDMAFADPPYFLSNGELPCQAGGMVSVNKDA